MVKVCENCDEEYWARWRNEALTLCPACRLDILVCSTCLELVRPPRDPRQGELFPELVRRAPSRAELPTIEERYWSLRAKASQATRRKYPYC